MTILGNIIKTAIELKEKLTSEDDPTAAQINVLKSLLERAKDTAFGKAYNFERILENEDIRKAFAQGVPIFGYDKIHSEWWHKIEEGETDVTWPGKPTYMALSSGTTSGASKKIPVTDDMLEATRQSSIQQITCLAHFDLPAEFFEKEIMMLSSTTRLNENADIPEGDISGISAGNIPFWFKNYCRPGEDILGITDFEKRIEEIALNAPKWDIGALSGIPSWIELMLKKIIEVNKLNTIHDIWPNLQVYATGGVAFGPYQKSFEQLLDKPLTYIDTYFCSEGFLAFQTRPETHAMALALSNGIYFEFVPFLEKYINEDGTLTQDAPHMTIEELREDEEYVILISTVSGAWRYVLGDTIKLVNKENNEIVITGRTKHFLNVVGSKLSVDTMNTAMQTLEAELGATITEFTVAAVKTDEGYIHKWYIGSSDLADSSAAAEKLDAKLQELNHNYQTAREQALSGIVVEVIDPNLFYEWNAETNKKGGQVKTPRVMKEEQFKEWEEFVNQQKLSTATIG